MNNVDISINQTTEYIRMFKSKAFSYYMDKTITIDYIACQY